MNPPLEPQIPPYFQRPSDASYSVENAVRLDKAQFRVLGRTDRLNRAGHPCSRLKLGNLAGTLNTVLHQYEPMPPQWQITHGDIVQVTGEIVEVADRIVLRTEHIDRLGTYSLQPTALLPRAWALPAFVPQLRTVVRYWQKIRSTALQRFLVDVFRDASTALWFLNVPASIHGHRAYQGGVLDHAADMLVRSETLPLFQSPSLDRDLALLLIILHDITKTVTQVGPERADQDNERAQNLAFFKLLLTPLSRMAVTDSPLAERIQRYFCPNPIHVRDPDPVYPVVAYLNRQSATTPSPHFTPEQRDCPNFTSKK